MAAILKPVKSDFSTIIWPILMKFYMMMHIIHFNPIGNQKFEYLRTENGGR